MAKPQPENPNPVGYLTLVRNNPDFRYLWFGQIVSLTGDWFNLIASASLVAMLTQSGLAVGGLFVVRMLAQFFGSLVGGVQADRYNRKHLLIFTDLVRAITVLGFLVVREPGQVWLLYTLTGVQLAFAGIFFPTRNAILPDVVSAGELGAANALSSATWSTMLALGAALGGVVAGQWGLKPAFVIDSLTFFISAASISQVRYHKLPATEINERGIMNVFSQYAEGLRYVSQNRDILLITLQKASMALGVTSAFQVIQVSLAREVFVIGEGGSTSLGILYAVVGAGTGLGPILARIFTGDDESLLRRAIVFGYPFAGIGLLIVSSLVNFPTVLFGTLLRGFGASVTWVFSTQLLLQLVPNQVRGRVFSTEYALVTLSNALGAGLCGWALDNLPISLPQMMWGMTAITLLAGGLWTLAGILRTSQGAEPLVAH